MKIKLFGRTLEIKASSVSSLPHISNETLWSSFLAGRGYAVSADTALQISAVFRCVDLISKTMATLPLHMLENTDKGKVKAKEHPVYSLVGALPNPYTTAYEYWQMYVANLLLTRGAFAKIVRNGAGRIIELWNIPTCNVSDIQVNPANGERFIDVTLSNGQWERLHDGEYMHTPGFLFDDVIKPSDPLYIASEVLGLTNTLGTFAKQAANAVNPGGYIETPSQLSPEAFAKLRTDFDKNYKGAMNSGAFMFLEDGMKATTFERDMEKMQALESRQYSVTEIARFFGVPPHMVMDLTHSTFSNIEQQSGEYVRDCVNPLSVRLEQTMFRDLLSVAERYRYYFKINTNALLRGDTAARTAYYNSARQNGWLNGDEIRELEDFDKMPDGQGEIYMVNGNMIPVSAVPLNLPKGAQAKGAGV